MSGTDKIQAPAIVPLHMRISVASLVIVDGPPLWRGHRIRLDSRGQLPAHLPARGYTSIGGGDDADVSIPALERFLMIENLDGDFVCDSHAAKYSQGAGPGTVLPVYTTIELAPFTFMYVPPTPDGLGIPPDYALLTVPKAEPTTEPALLVKSGYQRIIDRKFVIMKDRITIGGSLECDVPLFRLPTAFAARLTRGVGDLNFFVEQSDPAVKVTVAGSHGDRRILTAYASVSVADWVLSLLPPSRPSKTR